MMVRQASKNQFVSLGQGDGRMSGLGVWGYGEDQDKLGLGRKNSAASYLFWPCVNSL